MTVQRIAASKAKAWAIGVQRANGFHPRRIVWGRLLARAEKRKDEVIVRVTIVAGAGKAIDLSGAPSAKLRHQDMSEAIGMQDYARLLGFDAAWVKRVSSVAGADHG